MDYLESVLDEEMVIIPVDNLPDIPEKHLIAYIFDRTFRDLNEHHESSEDYREARAWVGSDDTSYPFSFNSLAYAMGIDPYAAKRQIFKALRNGKKIGVISHIQQYSSPRQAPQRIKNMRRVAA